ncbi:MAG: D-cysteine desulfhydrase [Gammaproteobacteria bacterium]|nr:D-cysteine desulfhydrase [Gammaproteobacteria bacterium]|tara:strand:+ start:195 stop:1190 length:996 start_codon:yes stop_codon:yes gene_type:complete
MKYPNRLNLANLPTPLTPLKKFEVPNFKGKIWIKRDELTGIEVSGNKIRKLEFTIAYALENGCNTLITCGGLQSNHCRATAVLGARLGLKVHLILRGEKPAQLEGNLLLDYLAGAEISYLPQRDWQSHEDLAHELQRRYKKESSQAHFIPIGASDEIGLWGYIAACEELQQDFRAMSLKPDYIVTATGSGGTQGGLLVGAKLFELPGCIAAFNVSDDANYFEDKIMRDVSLWKQRYKQRLNEDELDIRTIEGYLGPGYGIADREVFKTIAELARTEGIFLDPVYTGKAFHGMVTELQKAEEGQLPGAKDIVFIHTGGLFGIFPQQGNFRLD